MPFFIKPAEEWKLEPMCKCEQTGYIGEMICVDHLKEAYQGAQVKGDKPLMAVILLKQKALDERASNDRNKANA